MGEAITVDSKLIVPIKPTAHNGIDDAEQLEGPSDIQDGEHYVNGSFHNDDEIMNNSGGNDFIPELKPEDGTSGQLTVARVADLQPAAHVSRARVKPMQCPAA